MRSLLLAFSILQIANCTCPPGFEFISDYGECRGNYTRINAYKDEETNDVIEQCNGILGGVPIIIHNGEQQTYWKNRVSKSEWTAIGLTCNTTSTKWEWSDGSAVDYKPSDYNTMLDNTCILGYVWMIWYDGDWTYDSGHVARATDVFCTTPSRQPVPSSDGCDNFEDDSDDGVCYQIGATAENWQEAQVICASFGAEVASIHNEQENSFVRRLAVSKGAIGGVFLGATFSGKGNDFAWTDGSHWDYDNFYPGFPLNGLGECLLMDTGGTTGDWANVDCSSKLSVACIRKQNYSTPTCSAGPWKEGQIIYSPGFPFDASTPCDFILSVDVGKTVQLELLVVEAVPGSDYLIVYEHYFGANIIANLTRIVNDKTYTTTSSNYMRVSWQPKGGVNVRGLMMTFRAL